MTDPELSRLETLTRDYAAFQARKSGLATTLGGLLVCLMFWVVLMPTVFGVKVMQRPALEVFLLLPFLWLVLKAGLARLLATFQAWQYRLCEKGFEQWQLCGLR